MLFDELADKFEEWYKANKSEKTIDAYGERLKKLRRKFTGQDIRKVVIKQKTPEWCTLDMRVLKRMLHLAVEWEYLDKVPRMVIPAENKRTRFLTKEEIRELLNECDDEDLRMALQVGMGSGLRRDDLLYLKWSEVNLEEGYIHKHVKRRKETYKPMPEALVRALKAYKDDQPDDHQEYVFPQKKSYLQRFNALLKRIGFKDVTWHTLRHTYASWLVMSGADLMTVRDLMDHQSIATTQRYMHISMDFKRKAVQNLPQGMFQ